MNFSEAITSVTWDKQNLIRSEDGIINESEAKSFPSFVIQRALSYHAETVFYAAHLSGLMNKRNRMSNAMAYEFLLYALPKGKRFAKMVKSKNLEIIEVIMEMQKCSPRKAKDILKLLTQDQIDSLLKSKSEMISRSRK